MINRTSFLPALALILIVLLARGAHAQAPSPSPPSASPSPTATIPPVNPYGPTVTTTAALTNVGIPEFETFYYVSRGTSGINQLRQTPFLIKYTFNPRWELNLSGAGLESILSNTGSPSAFGDPSPGLKYLLAVPANAKSSTQALQLNYTFPISDPALGFSNGHPSQQLTYFYSQDYGRVHLDVNLWTTRLIDSAGTTRLQLGQGVGVTVPLNKSGTISFEGEWHNFARAGVNVPAVSSWMGVLYVSVHPQLTLAGGIDLGLTQATAKRTFIVGAIFHFGGKRR